MADLSEKTYILTGATSGIGLAAAQLLASQGAFLIGVGRSTERCAQAENAIHSIHPEARVEFCIADLALQSQVHILAAEVRSKLEAHGLRSLDGLINNAGTFTYRMAITPEGFETQWAVNQLAPFLLTHELLPLLQAGEAGRVVTVSSGSHYNTRLNWEDLQLRKHYSGLLAYKQTKLATVLFTAELNRRLGEHSKVRAFAADPGLVFTEMGFKGNPWLVRWVWDFRRRSGVTPQESARGVVYLATQPSIQNATDIYWKDSRPKAPNLYALDEDAARRLWELSEQECGIEPGKYVG